MQVEVRRYTWSATYKNISRTQFAFSYNFLIFLYVINVIKNEMFKMKLANCYTISERTDELFF